LSLPCAPAVRLFLCGDVMTGRGIDQILPAPCDPAIHEPYLKSALDYVRIAEQANGPIPRPAEPAYVWGDALPELERAVPSARIVNLETAVTSSDDWQAKGINYRMSPRNAACLAAARIDCCALANNHVLDWGAAGLAETIETLRAAGIRTAGAGASREEAEAPAVLPLAEGVRLLVFSLASPTSGVPPSWAARRGRPGVACLEDLSERTLDAVAAGIGAARQPGDLVIASVHWGPNWGYGIAPEEEGFARGLVERAGADVFHGHSSHHAKGMEVFQGKLILYGCGDLINDYEGIGGHEEFRGDLGAMYFPTLDAGSGRLLGLEMTVMRMRRFQARRAGAADARWLAERLEREGRRFGTRVELRADGRLELRL
jgi:poly-gamma-glutamate capsule biosynthesis protein CapA/YwtB (metallophosphatase superfamily)